MSNNTASGSVGYTRPAGALEAQTGLDTARKRRIDLRQAMERLENRVARPSATGSWRADVEAALSELGEALDAHISEVEGEGGLLASIVTDAPRLAGQAAEMRAEHDELRTGFDRALEACSGHGKLEPTLVRRRVTSLLGRIALHRQLGSELVFDAYNVDIGDGD
ncbi:MAG: hypothetical protein WEF28_12060 [Acidimicrobiia bacterium]